MASVLQQDIGPASLTQTPSRAFPSNVTQGSLLFFGLNWAAAIGTVASFSDTVGTKYSPLFALLQGASRSLIGYIGIAPASGPNTVNIGLSVSTTVAVALYEISGASARTDGTPVTIVSSTATTAPSVGPLTITNAADILLAALRGGPISASTPAWTGQVNNNFGTEYLIPAATGSYTASWTQTSTAYVAFIAALFPAANIFPTGQTSTEADGTPRISTGPVAISLIGVASTEADGTPNVNAGPVSIRLIGVASTEADGTPNISLSLAFISLLGLASTEADGVPRISTGPVAISLIGTTSTEADGIPNISAGPAFISLIGLASTEADGSPNLTIGPITIHPIGVASTEADGNPRISVGPVKVSLIGTPSTVLNGIPRILYQRIRPQPPIPPPGQAWVPPPVNQTDIYLARQSWPL